MQAGEYNRAMIDPNPTRAPAPRIRVLFGCPGWPSGLIEVGSWAARRGLAEVAIVQIQPGLALRLDAEEAELLAPGPVAGDLAAAFQRARLPLGRSARIVRQDDRAWQIHGLLGRCRYRVDRGDAGADVYDLANMVSPPCLAAIRRYEERTGQHGKLAAADGTPSAAVWAALAAVGGRFVRTLIDWRPHVVGFRTEGGDFERIDGFVRAAQLFSDAEIVLGGPTATSHPRDVLDGLGADYVFAGEAEETFAQFLELASRPGSRDRAAEIPGLVYSHGGRTYHNTLPQDGYERTVVDSGGAAWGVPLRCLRNLVRPVAGADVLQSNRLDWSLLAGFERPFDSLFFTGGRGCPGACTFCAKLHGQEVRAKTARQLFDEIAAADACVASGRLRVVRWPLFEHTSDPHLRPLEVAWAAVYDEDFFLHRHRAIEFLRLWDQSPLRGRYRLSFQTNPCTLLTASGEFHPELLAWIDRLKPMIQVGAESFHPEVLARWRKRHNTGQLDRVLDALETTRQDYTVFILLSDFETTPEELVETLRLLVLAALRRPRMRIASSPFTIPLFDSETRLRLEHQGKLGPGRVRHFTDYERPQPGWMDPLTAQLADLADAELRFALEPRHRDAALVQAMEVVVEQVRQSSPGWADRGKRLLQQAERAMAEVGELRFRAVRCWQS